MIDSVLFETLLWMIPQRNWVAVDGAAGRNRADEDGPGAETVTSHISREDVTSYAV
jgi:hypothetical protein